MPEYSYYLGDAVKSARIRQGLTQKQVADDLSIDDRTLTNIECNRGNPKMEILYPLVRYLNIDARDIFNPERQQDTPCMKQLRVLIDGCTEQEAKALIPVIQAVCSVLRDRNTLEMK